MRRVIFRPLADADAIEAKAWYAGRNVEAAERFIDALRTTVSLISEHPFAFPLVDGETRRAMLRRFPYAVYYRVTELAVIPGRSRSPGSRSMAVTDMIDTQPNLGLQPTAARASISCRRG